MMHRSPRTQLIRKSHHNELNIGHYKRKCKLYYSGVPLKETGSDKLDVYINTHSVHLISKVSTAKSSIYFLRQNLAQTYYSNYLHLSSDNIDAELHA